ncbi:MAG: GNAT family N-acetyltransferase [Erysipelotrichaceae bacterium]|nr:GNAT family N-acetyltransferase [Erysipelotrichaceae bacterium]
MKLNGQRILIRELSFRDKDAYYEFGKNPNVGPHAGWKPFGSKDISDRMLASLMLSKETFAIALKDSNMLIGTISIYDNGIRKYNKVKSIGFSLSEEYWNQGIMTEAVNLIIEYIFRKKDCELIEVGHHSDNFASKRVIEKCGFKYDGRLCKFKRLYDGRIVDADFYSLTIDEYERKMRYE